MNTTQMPNVFAGDNLVEDTSISNLILAGMKKDVEMFGSVEQMKKITLDTIPDSVKMYLDQSSIKVKTSLIGGTVYAKFLLPGLTNPIAVLGHLYYAKLNKSQISLNSCSWFYFKEMPENKFNTTLTDAENMEHAIFKAYEQEKKAGSA